MTGAELVGTGGPIAAICLALGYVLNYLIRRRASETGVVETTKATLGIVREQQQEMAAALTALRSENDDLRQRLRLKDEQFDRLQDRQMEESREMSENVARLERENAELRARLDRLENR